MILFRTLNLIRRGPVSRRNALHALVRVEEDGSSRWWVSECGRRFQERGDWHPVEQLTGDTPECRTCKVVLSIRAESESQDRSAIRHRTPTAVSTVVEAAAALQAEQQGVISRLRFEVLALQEVFANLLALHTRDGAGYCASCEQVFPCPTRTVIGDKSRIWRNEETDVAA